MKVSLCCLQHKDKLKETGERILEEVTELKEQADKLRAQLADEHRNAQAAQERHLRLIADFENFRKRTVRQCYSHLIGHGCGRACLKREDFLREASLRSSLWYQ